MAIENELWGETLKRSTSFTLLLPFFAWVFGWSIALVVCAESTSVRAKKAGVVENPRVLDHAGLPFDGSPGIAGLPFV